LGCNLAAIETDKETDQMPLDLIITRKETAAAMELADIAEICPAVLTETAAPETSGRYGFINTMQAMQILGDYGYRPTQATQRPSRNAAHRPFAMHAISFAHDSDLNENNKDSRPEIILYNSHDGKSALKLYSGCFRFICSNGIVAGNGFQSKMRHSHTTANGFESMLKETAANLPRMMQRVSTLQETTVDNESAMNFAYNAAALRWEQMPQDMAGGNMPSEQAKPGAYFDHGTVRDMFQANRYEDHGPTAWRIFNRIQENIMRGGPSIVSLTSRAKETGQGWKLRKSKAITSLPKTIDVNRKLWDLADEMA
jgi:hypothetical protein